MTLRICTSNNTWVALDNQTIYRPSEFTDTVKRHLALLKITEPLDIVRGVGAKLNEHNYIVDEIGNADVNHIRTLALLSDTVALRE